MNYLSTNIIVEIICFVISAVCLYRDKKLAWRGMALFMLLTCIIEIFGREKRHSLHGNNWIYNIFLIIEAIFTNAMYGYLIFEYTRNKSWLWIGCVILTISYIYETNTHIHGIFDFNNITATIMSVSFIGYSFYYYFLLITDEAFLKLRTHPAFWWVGGTLLFCYGSTVSDLFFSVAKTKNTFFYTNRHSIYICLNIILYSFWSYSFICRYHQRKLIA